MNIPGITDFDSEQLQEMTLEALEELQFNADSHAQEFQMQLEGLQLAGGVSAAHAAQFKAVLPQQVILESFTSQVTHTNYDVACESLSTAVKVAGAVGLIAVVGALGFVIAKLVKGKGVEPKVPAVQKVNVAAKGLEEVEAKATGPVQAEIVKSVEVRKQTLDEALKDSGLTKLGISFFSMRFGQDNFLVHAASRYEARSKELKDRLEWLPSMVKDAIAIGPEGTLEVFDRKVMGRRTALLSGRDAKKFGESVSNDHDKDYFSEPSPAFIEQTLRQLCSSFPLYPMDKFDKIRMVRAGFADDQKVIEATRKSLEGAPISKAIIAGMREYCDLMAEYLKELEGTLGNIDREIEQYNRAGAIWSKTVAAWFNDVKRRMSDPQTPLSDEQRANVKKILEDALSR